MSKVKTLVTKKYNKVVVGAGLLMLSASSMAAEGDAAQAAFNKLTQNVGTYEGYAWTLAGAITASLIGIKLFKKFANRAS